MSGPSFVTIEEAVQQDIPSKDDPNKTWPTHHYFGPPGSSTEGPQAFRVSREPHRESRAHFHHVDQFQVFYGGKDTVFQRHETGPLLIHYTDSDTFYGPFSSGDEPFKFMTLRQHGSRFKGYLPENKEEMSHDEVKRHYQHDLREWLESAPEGKDTTTETVIEPQPDNLAAYRITAAPGAKFSGPSPAGSGGQYIVVVEGEVLHDDSQLGLHSVGWVEPSDDPPVIVAGSEGAKLIVLQFGSQDPNALASRARATKAH